MREGERKKERERGGGRKREREKERAREIERERNIISLLLTKLTSPPSLHPVEYYILQPHSPPPSPGQDKVEEKKDKKLC